MILEVSRSYIKYDHKNNIIKVHGEMFFPPNDKMGFAVFLKEMGYWDISNKHELSQEDISSIIDGIRTEFEKGGHELVIE